MGRSKHPPIVFVFGGTFNTTPLRVFMGRFASDFERDRYKAWEKSSRTTAVRAIADPHSDSSYLVGVLLMSFQKRHLRIDHVVVDPTWRRQRIATNLFYRMMLDPRSQIFKTASALCPDNNDDAVAWLRYCKFKAISVIPASEPDERDHYLFTWSFDNLSSGEPNAICPGSDPLSGDTFKSCPLPNLEG